jgi:4-hydroxy-tetrahydrodipicolinate synthase
MKPEELQEQLKGPLPVMFTPFKKDNINEVDHDALRRNLRYLIAAGIKIVVTTGSNGEFSSLTDEERKAVWQTVVDEGKGKVIIIAGSAHSGTKGTIELTQYAEKIGVDGVMIVSPYYMLPDEEGLYQHFTHVAEATKLAVLLYNNPKASKVNISLPLLDRLAQIRNIISTKETGYDMNQFYRVVRVMEKHKKPVICGMAEHWYSWCGLINGCTGYITSAANWCPDIALELDDAVQSRDLLRIEKITRSLDPLREMLLKVQAKRNFGWLAVMKEPMDMIEGLSGGKVRLPLTPLTEQERAELRQIVKNLGRKIKSDDS